MKPGKLKSWWQVRVLPPHVPLVGAGKRPWEWQRCPIHAHGNELLCAQKTAVALQRRWVCANVGVQTPQEQPGMPGKIFFVHLISGKSDLHARCLLV